MEIHKWLELKKKGKLNTKFYCNQLDETILRMDILRELHRDETAMKRALPPGLVLSTCSWGWEAGVS